jgi:predicted amidophosphoribosyltransferase
MQPYVSYFAQKAKYLLGAGIDILFPARCAACAEQVGTHGALCARCWEQMHFIAEPLCYKCGLPFGRKRLM